jgi:hypothetical protein
VKTLITGGAIGVENTRKLTGSETRDQMRDSDERFCAWMASQKKQDLEGMTYLNI